MLQYTLEQARKIPLVKDRERVYCVITNKRGIILAEGENLYEKSHPKAKQYSLKAGLSPFRCYLHAEQRCIIRAAKLDPKGCKMYIARVGRSGKPLDAYPCCSCRMLIADSKFISSIEVTLGE